MHQPVLLRETVEFLRPAAGEVFVDATLGAGGHAEALLRKLGPSGVLLGIDRDEEAVERARQRLGRSSNVLILKANFADIKDEVRNAGFPGVDGVLFDLGISSDQLGKAERGFSFREEGPLDMRMDRSMGTRAEDLVNQLAERELADLFFRWGEERKARAIARRIVECRKRRPIRSTRELASLVQSVCEGRHGRLHPATRVFQALRIAVNDELGNLESGLAGAMELVRQGGRVVVISYHSLEDRLVKQAFREGNTQGGFELLTKKVVRPSAAEVAANIRARSGKLRAARRVAEG